MQLTFLGQPYATTNPTLEAIDTPETARFLGRTYTKKQVTSTQRYHAPGQFSFLGQRYSH